MGEIFTAATQHLTSAVVKYKIWKQEVNNHNKITRELQSLFD
jgi:hypothetical protein